MNKIQVFTDYSCPFCYLGFSILNKLKDEKSIEVEHLPVLLNPEEGKDGSDLSEHVSEERIIEGYKRVETLGKEYDLKYKNKMKRFNTNRLHLAALYAEEKGKYFEFSKLAFEYIFTYGINVGIKENVDEIAKKVGLNVKDMNEKINSNHYSDKIEKSNILYNKYKVDSVPTFIVNGTKKSTHLTNYDDFIKILLN